MYVRQTQDLQRVYANSGGNITNNHPAVTSRAATAAQIIQLCNYHGIPWPSNIVARPTDQ